MPDASPAPPAWSGPGIIQSFITIPESSKLSQATLEKWLDEFYVPALIATGVVTSAWRFKAANSDFEKPLMSIYKIPELRDVQGGKLQDIKRTSDLFPTSGPLEDFVVSESRILALEQLYETTTQPEDAATTIIHAAMEPGEDGEADLDAWYREEHNQQMSEQPGWKRTTRFNLLFQHRSDAKVSQRLSFLAIHEFGEGHKIGKDVEPLDPMTDWTKKAMSEAKSIEAAVYHKVKYFGKAKDDY
ncbi:hypothetical protein K505DRAFT_274721 [Melanomma pulvis-pyrius CBS 109.77]|uniref:EthD domain-containing protein n=1 Tax=Melanomma pulvis-pyrius CBS 109.77 TaxID=1314802 RepID=A0A6A6XEW1_9PLEO|nr:hypothetical protein K505DRAFT_274721 [Melanomma pulvis-pyrius CBS 109.77]